MEIDSHITCVESGLIIPQTQSSDFGRAPLSREHFIAGVLTDDNATFFGHEFNNTISQNVPLQRQMLVNVEPKLLKGSWFYGGIFAPHFGHFLAESCHRLWAWRQLKDHVDGVIFLPPPKFNNIEKWGSFVFDVLALFGIKKSQVKLVTDITTVENLFIPEQGASFHGDVKPWYENWLNENPLFLQHDSKTYQPRKLFISRRNYKLKGRVAGMDALADFLTSQGYKEVCPEEVSFEKQLSLIASAENIIWEEGSAVHLMELLPVQTAKAALIMRRPTNPNIKNFLEKKYNTLHTNSMLIMDQWIQSKPNNAQAYFANIDALTEELEERGFIETPSNVDLLKQQLIAEELEDVRSYLKSLKASGDERKQYINKIRLLQKLRRLGFDKRHIVKRALFNNALRSGANLSAPEDIRKIVQSKKFSNDELSLIRCALDSACSNCKQQIQKQNIQKAISELP